MNVDSERLRESIANMYPEIAQYGLAVKVEPDTATDAWLVTLRKGGNHLSTHVERADAEACLSGVKCVALGIQIGRFVENYCLGTDSCPAPGHG